MLVIKILIITLYNYLILGSSIFSSFEPFLHLVSSSNKSSVADPYLEVHTILTFYILSKPFRQQSTTLCLYTAACIS